MKFNFFLILEIMHKLMSGLGISEQTELLSFLCKGEREKENMQDQ